MHAVAWVQQFCARQVAQVDVAVMAGHDPPPLEVLPELEQLPDPPPMPPIPPMPPPDDPQLLLPLDDEQPKTASPATITNPPKRPRTRFIGEISPLGLDPTFRRTTRSRPPATGSATAFR